MRVLFVHHLGAFQDSLFGGAEVQMLKTKEALEQLEVSVKFFNPLTDQVSDFDVVHLFMPWALPFEALHLMNYANQRGVKVVVSPIYWSFNEFNASSVKLHGKLLRASTGWAKKFIRKYSYDFGFGTADACLNKVFRKADTLLPNSHLEADLLVNTFGISSSRIHVVPNAVDTSFFDAKSDVFMEKFQISDFILYVGRLEKRKNVARLVQAFHEAQLDTNLVLIGSKGNDYSINPETDKNVLYLGHFPYGSDLLKSAYSACKVFALPSWFETPGLAALEAGAAGANVVITDRGSTKEYFKDYAWYIDPNRVESIREALVNAFCSSRSTSLRNRILTQYTWNKVATETLSAYKNVL